MIDLKKLRKDAAASKSLDQPWYDNEDAHGFGCEGDDIPHIVNCSPDVILSLLDMLEAAKLDAARYQLIRKSGLPEDAFGDCDSYYGVYKSQVGEALDAAIDAAMAATKGEQA